MPDCSRGHNLGRRGPSVPITGPDASLLREALAYDRTTGSLTWKNRPVAHFRATATRTAEHNCRIWNSKNAGRAAGTVSPKTGYRHIFIWGRSYLAHRLAWTIATGNWPDGEIDHKNGDRLDNRWSNLRLVERERNCQNQQLRRDNTSGATGVYAVRHRWKALIGKHHLGTFDSFELAVAARRAAERVLGYSNRHGR